MEALLPGLIFGLIVFLFMVAILRWAFRINPIVARLDSIISLLEDNNTKQAPVIPREQTTPDMR